MAICAVAFFANIAVRNWGDRRVSLIEKPLFSAGGGSDITARVVAEKMSKTLGQQILVDNAQTPVTTYQPTGAAVQKPVFASILAALHAPGWTSPSAQPDLVVRIMAAMVNPVGPAPEHETVTLLNYGRVIVDGDRDSVVADQRTREVYLGV